MLEVNKVHIYLIVAIAIFSAVFFPTMAPAQTIFQNTDVNANGFLDKEFGGTDAGSAAAARVSLGLEINVDVQAYDPDLAAIAALSCADKQIIKRNAALAWECADHGSTLGLGVGTPWRIIYTDGDGVVTELPLGSSGTYLKSAGTEAAPAWDVAGAAGTGTIGGTLGSTANAAIRSSGTGGLTAQGSLVTISDAGGINIPAGQTFNIGGSAHTHNYQPADSDLTIYAGITPSVNVQSLLGAANYSAMRTLLTLVPGTDVQAYDADLLALAGLSGVRGDIIYRDATQWQRLAKGTSGKVLKMGESDPFWGDDANDGGGGISTWNQIGNSAADVTIAFGGYKTIFTSTLNTAGANLTYTNTTADLTADTSFIDFKYTDDGDSNGFFMRGYDNAGNDLKWSIGPEGAFYGYSYETAQSATGGVLDLLEGTEAGSDYIRIKADDDVGSNRKLAISTSVADSEDLTIQLGSNDNKITLGSSTGATELNLSALNMVTTGQVSGRIPVVADADGKTLSGTDLYGSMQLATGAGTWVIPDVDAAAGTGMSFCVYSTTAAEIVIDGNAEDKIRLNGTLGAAGGNITNATAEAAGDFVCLMLTDFSSDVAHWTVLGKSGTWTVP